MLTKKRRAFLTTSSFDFCNDMDSFKCEGEGASYVSRGYLWSKFPLFVFGDENISAANIQVSLTVASDQRDKTDFTALDLGLDFVKGLKPVTYKWDKRSWYLGEDETDVTAVSRDGSKKKNKVKRLKTKSLISIQANPGGPKPAILTY